MGTGAQIIAQLRKTYGSGSIPEPSDPFELIVWENCAYLVDDERRMSTYEELRKRVGVTPLELLSANIRSIEGAIDGGGMRPADRAAKLIRCAEIVLQFADGDLSSALAQADDQARKRLLKRFPGIGDPGEDKVLLISGYSNKPALESNGLRVLERLGVIGASASYATSYRAGITYLREQAVDAREAFGLLREHGRVLCKRTGPHCPECRLRSTCPSAIN